MCVEAPGIGAGPQQAAFDCKVNKPQRLWDRGNWPSPGGTTAQEPGEHWLSPWVTASSTNGGRLGRDEDPRVTGSILRQCVGFSTRVSPWSPQVVEASENRATLALLSTGNSALPTLPSWRAERGHLPTEGSRHPRTHTHIHTRQHTPHLQTHIVDMDTNIGSLATIPRLWCPERHRHMMYTAKAAYVQTHQGAHTYQFTCTRMHSTHTDVRRQAHTCRHSHVVTCLLGAPEC